MKTFLTHLQESGLNPQFNYGGSSTGQGLDQYDPAANLNAQSEREIKKSDLDQIEKYADRIFASLGIDVEFTRHFLDRVNDERNVKQITPSELTRLFKQSYKKYGKTIAKLGPDAQAVINDMKTDINMPFVLNVKGGELELVAKTVMRKKNFKTTDRKFAFESVSDIFHATKLLAKYYKTRKDEDAFKAIKFGWSYIQNPKIRKSIVLLIKYIASKSGHNDWNNTVKYIKKNTGVDISDYEQDWKKVKGGYTFTKFVPEDFSLSVMSEEFKFFPDKLYEKITLPDYPKDTQKEIEIVKKLIDTRTKEDEESIRNHDENASYAIEMYCKENGLKFDLEEEFEDFKAIKKQCKETGNYFKNKFSRPRPFQVDKDIKPFLKTETTKTRSYPSGHAYQATLVGLYVTRKYPEHREAIMKAAEESGMGRVLAGFHYVTDYECGKLLANKMFLVMNRDNYEKI